MDLFDKYKKEEYSYEVTGAEIDSDSMQLTIEIDTDFVVPYSALSETADRLIEEVPEIENVEYHFEYRDIKQGRKRSHYDVSSLSSE